MNEYRICTGVGSVDVKGKRIVVVDGELSVRDDNDRVVFMAAQGRWDWIRRIDKRINQ